MFLLSNSGEWLNENKKNEFLEISNLHFGKVKKNTDLNTAISYVSSHSAELLDRVFDKPLKFSFVWGSTLVNFYGFEALKKVSSFQENIYIAKKILRQFYTRGDFRSMLDDF